MATTDEHPPHPFNSSTPRARLDAFDGPDVGRRFVLGPGRHVLGRGPAARCRLDDPALRASHAVVTVEPTGRVRIEELGLGTPGGPAADGSVGDGGALGTGHDGPRLVRLGRSWFAVTSLAVPTAHVRVTQGRARAVREIAAVPLPGPAGVPPSTPSPVGIATVASAWMVGAVAGVVAHEPVLLRWSLVAGVGAVVAGAARYVRARRERRRTSSARDAATAACSAALDDQAAAVRRLLMTPVGWSVGESHTVVRGPWQEGADVAGAWWVRIGCGEVDWDPLVVERSGPPERSADPAPAPRCLGTVGVPYWAGPGTVTGFAGADEAVRAVRSVVAQLAVAFGPADLAVVVLASREHDTEWEWVSALPHCADGWGRPALAVGTDGEEEANRVLDGLVGLATTRHVLLVCDDDGFALRASLGRRLLDRVGGQVVGLVVAREGPLPAVCTTEVTVSELGTAELARSSGPSGCGPLARIAVRRFAATGLGAESAASLARSLARPVDPRRLDRQRGLAREGSSGQECFG